MDLKIKRRVPFWFALSVLSFSVSSGVLICDIFLKEILHMGNRSINLNRSITLTLGVIILTPLVVRERHQGYPSFNGLSSFGKISIIIGLLLSFMFFAVTGIYWLKLFYMPVP